MNHNERNIKISDREIGANYPTYFVAEMSANHNQDIGRAKDLIRAAQKAGADAIKLQTYTPDTLTIDCDEECFQIGEGTIWQGRNLYDLYKEACTPWEWQPELKKIADDLGMDFFSTPFDETAVDFLEELAVPVHKIASFEVVDLSLVRRIAQTGKPVIMSTGMATLSEIDKAVQAVRSTGNNQIALLKCTSAYPAFPEEMNLATIPHLADAFSVTVGLSDHTLDLAVPITSVVLGARIIEKHFTLSRNDVGPDSAFSLEPQEFRAMVDAVRTAERAIGQVHYGISERETKSRVFRRSLFVVEDMKEGDEFTSKNVRSIRPGFGLAPSQIDKIVGARAKKNIKRGSPLSWDMLL